MSTWTRQISSIRSRKYRHLSQRNRRPVYSGSLSAGLSGKTQSQMDSTRTLKSIMKTQSQMDATRTLKSIMNGTGLLAIAGTWPVWIHKHIGALAGSRGVFPRRGFFSASAPPSVGDEADISATSQLQPCCEAGPESMSWQDRLALEAQLCGWVATARCSTSIGT